MYIAMNKPQASDLLSKALTCMQVSSSNGNWFALLDKAFDFDRKTPLRWPHPSEAIYKGADGIDAVSPTLLVLSSRTSEALAQEIACLLRHCQGRPMLSFVQSSLDLADLAAAWQDIKWVYTEDGQRFLLRWADTRVLASLPDALQTHNWKRICRPLMAWLMPDRLGNLQTLTMRAVMPDSAGRTKHLVPFRLDDKELTLLLEAAQPDVLISMLFEQIPDVLPVGADKAKVHGWVQQACEFAALHGIEVTGDQLALAATACLTEGTVFSHPRLLGLLTRYQPGLVSLADILAELLPVDEVSAP